MEKTSVIGFPRVGAHRELKFAIEKYFAGKVGAGEVQKTAAEMRAYGWKKQKDAGISFIASNDFSFYDNMLDTAFMLGALPSRYAKLGLSPLDTYFAMAHGYQGDKGDVKALPMKKWFNTNYHYLVPELEEGVKLSVQDGNKAVSEFLEAKAQGVDTVPYLIGPYTFLHFANYTGAAKAADYASDIKAAYIQELSLLAKAGAQWVALAEPALVFDVGTEDCAFFTSLYKDILSEVKKSSSVKVELLTYFGDIRDSYAAVTALPFDGIGLDFIEGKESLNLIKKGFSKDKILFAGIVNGKNIWRANYEKKLELYKEITKYAPNAVIGTSCSLLHVPYTTANEGKLGSDVLRHFAFAEQKLGELSDLAKIAAGNPGADALLSENKKLFDGKRTERNEEVWKKIGSLKDDDFVRKPAFAEREKVQKDVFKLPLFPTTTIGSFPQTKEVRANRAAFKKGEITEEQYIDFNKKQIADCIKMQEELDIDVLVHGEFERNDMVEYFGDHLDGYRFTENAWVQSYGTRCVKPPVIWGDVSRREAITVFWSKYAQSCTKRPMKGMLTGPVTILNWSFPREDISLKEQTLQIALAIKEEVLDLEKNGIRIIQIDEAALREKLPLRKSDWHTEYLDWAVPAFRLVHSTVKPETQIHTHMCYSEFGDIIKDIDADVISFEASRADLTILDDLKAANFRTEVGPGVYDIHSPRIPSKEEIVEALKKMVQKVPVEKLWVNPDCGLKTRGTAETLPSLKNLVAAAKEMRQSCGK